VQDREDLFINLNINTDRLANAVRACHYLYLTWDANDNESTSFNTKMKWVFDSVSK